MSDPIEQISLLWDHLKNVGAPVASHTFQVKLPSEDWEAFEGSDECSWRRIPAKVGRSIEFRAPSPFVFGRHYHAFSEVVTLREGLVIFGNPDLSKIELLEPGQSAKATKGEPHVLRVLKDAMFQVDWKDLNSDTLTITTA